MRVSILPQGQDPHQKSLVFVCIQRSTSRLILSIFRNAHIIDLPNYSIFSIKADGGIEVPTFDTRSL